jgi:hypothetical protein
MKTKILAIIIITTIFMGCTPAKRYNQVLNLAENEMKSHPEKALTLLDSLQKQHPDFSTRQKMKYELLRQDALNKTDYVFKSDSTAKVLADYYDRKGTPNEKMKAYYLLGRAYMDMKEWPAALQSMLDAASKADTTARNCDYYTLCRIHAQASEIYRFQMMSRNQLQELALSEKHARKANDTLTMINEYAYQVFAYESLRNRDSVIAISEKAAALYQKYGYRQKAAIMISNAVHDLVQSRQYRKAGRYINYYKAHSGLFDAKGNIARGYEIFYYTLSLYYMGIGKPDSAEYYLHKELREGKDYNNQIASNYCLAKLYMQTGRQALAAKYALRAYDINDSAYVQQTADHLQNIQSLYDYSRNQNIAAKATEEKKAADQRDLFLILLIAFAAVIIILLWKRKVASEARARENYERDRELLMEKQEYIEHLKKDNNSQKEHIEEKEEEIARLRQRLQAYDKSKLHFDYSEAPIYKTLQNCLSETQGRHLTDAERLELREWMSHTLPNFYHELITLHGLSTTEYDICILTRMDFRWVLIIIFFEILIPPEPFMRDAPHFFYRKYNKNLL